MITHYWSRSPGKFVNAKTGEHRADLNLKYEGTVRAGYSASNIAFGMGGALLQMHNRDTQNLQ